MGQPIDLRGYYEVVLGETTRYMSCEGYHQSTPRNLQLRMMSFRFCQECDAGGEPEWFPEVLELECPT